jgi:cytosine/adenosine deaminase-related metal-dependent hydrolase
MMRRCTSEGSLTRAKELLWIHVGIMSVLTIIVNTSAQKLRLALLTSNLDVDDRLGTLEVGKLADVIVINGKPSESH